MRKILLLLVFSLAPSAYAIDYAKTCEIASKYVSPIYSFNYDYYVDLFSKTKPKSKERIKGIQATQEQMEKILDGVSAKLNSLEPSDKYAVMSVYNFSIRKMDLQATNDAGDNISKQPTERIERFIFSACVSTATK